MRLFLCWTALVGIGAPLHRPAHAQDSLPVHLESRDSAPRPVLEWEPRLVTEGTVGWIRARPILPAVITGGQAAGEPIHFELTGPGEYRALVGTPIEPGDSLRVMVFVATSERIDTVVVPVAVRRGGYPRERIAVAPAFVRPDSAAAARIRAELARSREVSRRSQTTPRLWQGAFRLPRSTRITSVFGSARVYNGEVKSRHLGTDFAGAVGAPVRAAGRGVVALVGDFYLAGRSVYINHGGGLITTYFHLSRVEVAEGDTVVTGQLIGRVGQSGRVTGPHLHWAARYGKIAVNPMSLLELDKDEAESASAEGPTPRDPDTGAAE